MLLRIIIVSHMNDFIQLVTKVFIGNKTRHVLTLKYLFSKD